MIFHQEQLSTSSLDRRHRSVYSYRSWLLLRLQYGSVAPSADALECSAHKDISDVKNDRLDAQSDMSEIEQGKATLSEIPNLIIDDCQLPFLQVSPLFAICTSA